MPKELTWRNGEVVDAETVPCEHDTLVCTPHGLHCRECGVRV